MPYSLSSYVSNNAATSNSSLDKCSLLTPPLTPLDEHETPYKPTDSDRTSLNMKRKRHYHDKDTHEIRHVDSDSGMGLRKLGHLPVNEDTIERSDSARSRSFSFIPPDYLDSNIPQCSTLNFQNKSSEKDGNTRSRRWTLPSKSTATRSVTPLRSTVKRSTSKEGSESPAMITLRRATTNRSAQRTELTFFPEPKFGGQKTGLLSYLLSSLTRNQNSDERDDPASSPTKLAVSEPTSTSINKTCPTMTFAAPTVYTEATVETDLAMPGFPMRNSSLRRCSTKYTSGGSTYEIIWDENETSSSSHRSSEQVVGTGNRRPSRAVLKLEAQLFRNYTRESSDCSSTPSSRTSVGSEKMFLDKVLTAEKLRQILPRLFHNSSLRDLPISKGSQRLRRPFSHPTTGDLGHQYVVDNGPRTPAGGIEFFPPLQSRKASASGSDLVGLERRETAASTTPPSPRQTRLGSLVGSSNHVRRRSSALPEKLRHGNSVSLKGKARMTSISFADFQSGESETQPLLGKIPNRRTSRQQGY